MNNDSIEIEESPDNSQDANMLMVDDNKQAQWRGHSMNEIYRNLSPWNYNHLPPIQSNRREHTVLYNLPWLDSSTTPPESRSTALKWDADHVRLPSSSRNEYLVKDDDNSQLHTAKKRWDIIEIALLQPISSSRELEKAILSYNTKYAHKWKFDALHTLFEEELDESETNAFFGETLPAIIRLALRLPELVPCAIPLLKHGINKSISLSQQQVACLLANAFLCTYPRRNTADEKAEYKNYPNINFSHLFQLNYDQVLEKIKCICCYFTSICKKEPLGVITFTRRSKKSDDVPKWSTCDSTFDTTLVHISTEGTIEDDGIGLLQVDFANKYLGGGVLGYGCVQEEIRFVICPELLISKLFTERLGPLECLVINGCEQFSTYTGYASTFKWQGPYTDKTPFDGCGRRRCCIVAIDAVCFQESSHQYKDEMMLRELNKAFVGFYHGLKTPAPGVATGNWGCGAFNGDKSLKSLLQLMVCCVTNRPLVYYTFGDQQLRDDFDDICHYLAQHKIKVSTLWSYLRKFRTHNLPSDQLYPFIVQSHRDSCSVPDSSSNNTRARVNRTTPLPASLAWSSTSETETDEENPTRLEKAVIHSVPDTRPLSCNKLNRNETASSSRPQSHNQSIFDQIDIIESISIMPSPPRENWDIEMEKPSPSENSKADLLLNAKGKRTSSLLDCLDDNYFINHPTKMRKESTDELEKGDNIMIASNNDANVNNNSPDIFADTPPVVINGDDEKCESDAAELSDECLSGTQQPGKRKVFNSVNKQTLVSSFFSPK